MISGFVVYRCHGNMDFSKIAIMTKFSLNPIGGKNFKKSLLKSCLKILGMALKKLYRNRLEWLHLHDLVSSSNNFISSVVGSIFSFSFRFLYYTRLCNRITLIGFR